MQHSSRRDEIAKVDLVNTKEAVDLRVTTASLIIRSRRGLEDSSTPQPATDHFQTSSSLVY